MADGSHDALSVGVIVVEITGCERRPRHLPLVKRPNFESTCYLCWSQTKERTGDESGSCITWALTPAPPLSLST